MAVAVLPVSRSGSGSGHGPRLTATSTSHGVFRTELGRDDVPVEVREACALELGLLSGGDWVEVSGWITRQRRLLAALGARLAATGSALTPKLHAPGEWVADRLGRRRS